MLHEKPSVTPFYQQLKWRKSEDLRSLTALPARVKVLRDLLVYMLALWGFCSILLQALPAQHFHVREAITEVQSPQGCDCGDSIAEARSLGCKFDSLSMAWLPEHCRDDELTAEFDTAGSGPNGTWVYYADTEHTIEVDVETVASMGNDPTARVHMDKTWHTIHCIFYWRKQFRTRLNGKIVEPRSDSEAHIKHCGMVLQEPGYGTISGVALNTDEIEEE